MKRNVIRYFTLVLLARWKPLSVVIVFAVCMSTLAQIDITNTILGCVDTKNDKSKTILEVILA